VSFTFRNEFTISALGRSTGALKGAQEPLILEPEMLPTMIPPARHVPKGPRRTPSEGIVPSPMILELARSLEGTEGTESVVQNPKD